MKDILIRVLVSVVIILVPFLEKTDIDKLIYILPVAYVFASYFLKDLSKYALILADTLFFIFAIYLTYNPITAIFIFPLFISYLENKKQLYVFLTSGAIVSLYSFYISEYIEFSMVLFWIPISLAIVLVSKTIQSLKNKIKEKNEEIQNKTNEIAKLKEKTYKIKIDKLDKIDFTDKKSSIFRLNQILNTSSISYFDFKSQKCIYTNKNRCDKDLLKTINKDFGKINKGNYTVLYIVEYENGEPVGVYFFFYDSEKLEDSIFNFIFLKEKLNS